MKFTSSSLSGQFVILLILAYISKMRNGVVALPEQEQEGIPALRGKTINNEYSSSSSSSSTHQLDDKERECVLYLTHVLFENPTHHKHTWSCQFTKEQATEFGGDQRMMEIKGLSEELLESRQVVSGESVMKFKGVFLEWSIGSNFSKLVVPDEVLVQIENLPRNDPRHQQQQRGRNFAKLSGTLRTVVVRVIDANNTQPSLNSVQLKDRVFTDLINLKTQMEGCSKNQLIIEPANVGSGGIVNVRINIIAKNSETYELFSAARKEVQKNYGDSFDLILYVLPPGTLSAGKRNWVAYGYLNWINSVYNDRSVNSLAVQVHEVGHNLGLGHSGRGDSEYGDHSSMMGNGGAGWKDGPIHCFNAYNNFHLGWYDMQKASINPLQFSNPQTFVMNGVDDYKTDGSSNGELITLRLENVEDTHGTNYYIGYNRASGFNRGTLEAINTVVVFSTSEKDIRNRSKRIADLPVGHRLTLSDFRSSGYDVYVDVKNISSNQKDATIVISSSKHGSPPSAPPPTFPPTWSDTSYPTPESSMLCEDDPYFYFKRAHKTCAGWVGKGKNKLHKQKKYKKIQKKCKKKVIGQFKIWDFCQETCALVDLGDCATKH